VSSWFTALCSEKTLQAMAVKESINGKDYYWISECGTSMASPHAAGIIACWLQADLSLSVKDIIEIAQSTANKSYSDISDPKWGAGNIDAYVGLKEVLKRGGIGNVSYNKDEVLFHSIGNKEVYVEIPNSEMLELNLYSISGSKVLTQPNGYVDARNLASGVYIISVLHSKGECVERILIK
jgi:subtilisin family serine protease